jgi:hypothetical protein
LLDCSEFGNFVITLISFFSLIGQESGGTFRTEPDSGARKGWVAMSRFQNCQAEIKKKIKEKNDIRVITKLPNLLH